MAHIGHIIKELRDDRDWTQQDLADRTGFRRDYIARLEKKESPRMKLWRWKALADAFEMRLSSFLAYVGAVGPEEPPKTLEQFLYEDGKLKARQVRDLAQYYEYLKERE